MMTKHLSEPTHVQNPNSHTLFHLKYIKYASRLVVLLSGCIKADKPYFVFIFFEREEEKIVQMQKAIHVLNQIVM